MRKITFFVMAISLMMLVAGCNLTIGKQHTLEEVRVEKPDLNHNEIHDSTKIFFSVNNKAELTFSPKISVSLDEDCFQRISEKALGDIPPKEELRTYIQVQLAYSHSFEEDECVGKTHMIKIELEDINGGLVYETTAEVSIV